MFSLNGNISIVMCTDNISWLKSLFHDLDWPSQRRFVALAADRTCVPKGTVQYWPVGDSQLFSHQSAYMVSRRTLRVAIYVTLRLIPLGATTSSSWAPLGARALFSLTHRFHMVNDVSSHIFCMVHVAYLTPDMIVSVVRRTKSITGRVTSRHSDFGGSP